MAPLSYPATLVHSGNKSPPNPWSGHLFDASSTEELEISMRLLGSLVQLREK